MIPKKIEFNGDLMRGVISASDFAFQENWSIKQNFTYKLRELNNSSDEYMKVVKRINEEKTSYSTFNKYRNVKISSIENPFLYGQFLLKKQRLKIKEFDYYHGTIKDNIAEISRNNFDWRKTKKQKFGYGVHFTPRYHFASYMSKKKAGPKTIVFLNKVLIGQHEKGTSETRIPSEGYDTTTDHFKKKIRAYLKFEDDDFYPSYVIEAELPKEASGSNERRGKKRKRFVNRKLLNGEKRNKKLMTRVSYCRATKQRRKNFQSKYSN